MEDGSRSYKQERHGRLKLFQRLLQYGTFIQGYQAQLMAQGDGLFLTFYNGNPAFQFNGGWSSHHSRNCYERN